MLSSVHAVLAIMIWLHMTFISCKIPKQTFLTDYRCLDYTSGGMEVGMMISLAYFICDFISVKLIFVKGRMVLETFLHHMIAITGICSALVIGRCLGPIMISLLITEISTIFLNNRFIMKEVSYDEKSILFKANGIALIISFFISRILFMGFLLIGYVGPIFLNYDYAQAEKEIGVIKVTWGRTMMFLYGLLYILNIFWFSKLIQGYKKFIKAQ